MHLPPYEQAKILFFTPHMGRVTPQFALRYMALQRPSQWDAKFLGYTYLDDARNDAAHTLLQSDYEYLMFIDSDTLFEAEDVKKLYSMNTDIATGVYHLRAHPFSPVLYFENEDMPDQFGRPTYRSVELDENDGQRIVPVDSAGTGFMLIKRAVLEKWADLKVCKKHEYYHMAIPDFDWMPGCKKVKADVVKPFRLGLGFGEDMYFCHWSRHLFGTEILANLDINLGHIMDTAIYGKQWLNDFTDCAPLLQVLS